MEGRLIDKNILPNGVEVYFYDRSRTVAGDRCYVDLLVVVPIEVQESFFQECANPSDAYARFTAAHGNVCNFQQKKVRNFIPCTAVEGLLREMKEEFMKSNRSYLCKPDFAQKFVMRQYLEWEKRERQNKAHKEAILRADKAEAEHSIIGK